MEDHDAYYSPDAPYRLLCPHSWKQTQDEIQYQNEETEGDQAGMMLVDGGYIMNWNRGKTTVFVPLDPVSNLPTIASTSSFKAFSSFVSKFQAYPTVIPDNDDEEEGHYQEAMRFQREEEPVVTQGMHQGHEEDNNAPRRVGSTTKEFPQEKPVSVDDPITP